MSTTEEQIAEIEARTNAATDGEWEAELHKDASDCGAVVRADTRKRLLLATEWLDDDLEFVAHAREDIPWLIEQVRSLREANERLKKQIAGAMLVAHHAIWIVGPCTDGMNPRMYECLRSIAAWDAPMILNSAALAAPPTNDAAALMGKVPAEESDEEFLAQVAAPQEPWIEHDRAVARAAAKKVAREMDAEVEKPKENSP